MRKVRIRECSDRYIIEAEDDGELIPDRFGFEYEDSAMRYAKENGYEVIE